MSHHRRHHHARPPPPSTPCWCCATTTTIIMLPSAPLLLISKSSSTTARSAGLYACRHYRTNVRPPLHPPHFPRWRSAGADHDAHATQQPSYPAAMTTTTARSTRCGPPPPPFLRAAVRWNSSAGVASTIPSSLTGAAMHRPSSPASSSSWMSTSSSPQMMMPPPPQLPPVLPSPSSYATVATVSDNNNNKSSFQRWWDRHSIRGQQRRSQLAETYFQAATRRAQDPLWYGPGRVGQEFRPRHALLTMHIWFLHKRLIHDNVDPDTALLVQEELFNILWDDTTSRIRQTGTSELLVNKHLMQVQQYTFLHLTHYDHAYTDFYLQRPLERMKELRNLVSHHIFRDHHASAVTGTASPGPSSSVDDESTTEDSAGAPSSSSSSLVSSDLLDRYAWYIEANYQNIMMHWPDQYYREGRVAWVNVPDFTSLRDSKGDIMAEHPVNADDVLPTPWLTNITRRGVEYYWNPDTRQSSWERPQSR